jgi:chorismate mutase
MWEIPIELRRRYPTLPVICDPSHITGDDQLVAEIAQRALDLDFDGLMIEVHENPGTAMSDGNQQLTPVGLKQILAKLVVKSSTVKDIEFTIKLEALRNQIDLLDREIIMMLAKRMGISKEIGNLKSLNGVTVFQMDRWSNLYLDRVKSTVESGLSEQFAHDFIQSIHKESIKQQIDGVKKENLQPNEITD